MPLFALKLLAPVAAAIFSAAWLGSKFYRDRAPRSKPIDPEINVKAQLQVTRTHGWTFFNMVLENRSRMRISVVDVTFSITNLVAKHQACPPTEETTFKIHRAVNAGDILAAGLVELFYQAAGKPQSGYSFLVSTTIRYRGHGDLFEQTLPLYRVRMVALSPNHLERVRWYNKPADLPQPSRELPALEPADLKWLESDSARAA